MNRTLVALVVLAGCVTTVRTPLHDAVHKGASVDRIHAIVNDGVDVNAHDPNGRTALMYAAMRATDPEVIRLLVAAGAKVNAVSHWSRDRTQVRDPRRLLMSTPLHFAAMHNGNPDVVVALIEAGAKVNEPDGHRNRPLHLATRYSTSPAVVSALIAAGSKVNEPDSDGNWPLHLATKYNGNPAVIAALIEGGADQQLRNDDGNTAFEIAAERGIVDDMEAAGVYLERPVVAVAANSGGDDAGKWIAGALMGVLLASQAENIPADKLVEIAGAAAADLINETGGENLRRIGEEGRTETTTGATLPGATAADDAPGANEINEIIRRAEGDCVGGKYMGSRNPNDHNTTFQCAAAFVLECNLESARNGGRSPEWIAAAERHLRTQCQRISELQKAGVMGACPHCSLTLDLAGCGSMILGSP